MDREQLVEFRNYTLVEGAAEPFTRYFEQHFLESQEELGMDIVGQFTVPGDDARFVWVRRFLQPESRAASLNAFYTSPLWREHGPGANEMMIDVSDVYLLTPDPSMPGFAADHIPHAQRSEGARPGDRTVVAAVYDLGDADRLSDAAVEAMRQATADGLVELGRLVTAMVENEFPALPVHEDGTVALWLLATNADDGDAALAAAETVPLPLVRTLRLHPTERSTLG